MAVFGILSGDLISNAIVAESLEDAINLVGEKIVELPVGPGEPGIGWKYLDGVFIEPSIEQTETGLITEQIVVENNI